MYGPDDLGRNRSKRLVKNSSNRSECKKKDLDEEKLAWVNKAEKCIKLFFEGIFFYMPLIGLTSERTAKIKKEGKRVY